MAKNQPGTSLHLMQRDEQALVPMSSGSQSRHQKTYWLVSSEIDTSIATWLTRDSGTNPAVSESLSFHLLAVWITPLCLSFPLVK